MGRLVNDRSWHTEAPLMGIFNRFRFPQIDSSGSMAAVRVHIALVPVTKISAVVNTAKLRIRHYHRSEKIEKPTEPPGNTLQDWNSLDLFVTEIIV